MPTLAVSVITFPCETLELRGDYIASRPLNCQQPIDLKDRANRKAKCECLTPWKRTVRDCLERELDVHLGGAGNSFQAVAYPAHELLTMFWLEESKLGR